MRNSGQNNEILLLALGANMSSAVGAPQVTLEKALNLLRDSGVRVAATARWRRSVAFPRDSGPDFVNGAARVETDLEPDRLMARLHEIEQTLGRVRRARWAPRVCDLDLIAYGARVTPDAATVRALMALGQGAGGAPAPDRLILPHPRMAERAFVLAPLADIAPGWRHPLTGRSVTEMLGDLPPEIRAEVEIIG
ncbi:MAG: 2-amino-4-hydroxy-6-hydroxymethyldihydropteridine diphosphokinase [Paracoccaceae bacterium]